MLLLLITLNYDIIKIKLNL